MAMGNPGHRSKGRSEPKPGPASLKPPNTLREDAEPFWKSLAPQLIELGLLTRADVHAFARYCNLLARYRELDRFLMTKGVMGTTYSVRDKRGRITGAAELPQAWEYRNLQGQLLSYEREFGLTPSARVGLKVEKAREF